MGFDFFSRPELPAPRVSEVQAEQILATYYDMTGRAVSLGSQQDKNFLIAGADGEVVGVLKIANAAFTPTELQAQDAAAVHLAAAEPQLRVAVPAANTAGETLTAVTNLGDGTAYVRLLRFLPGGTVEDAGHLGAATVAGLGEVSGRVSRALAGFAHPGLDRVLQWDLRFADRVVALLNSHVADTALRQRLRAATGQAWARIEALDEALPRQAVHLDLTDANIVLSTDTVVRKPDGIIDFGDLTTTWAVSELAVTA